MSPLRTIGYLGMAALSGPWRRWGPPGDGLRILAYHGVPDARRFEDQIRHLVSHYSPISGPLDGDEKSPKPPVWVTFDDGDSTIVDNAMPVLDRYGICATAFVCPGLIGTSEPFWWDVVESAADQSVTVDGVLVTRSHASHLKGVPDAERRAFVEELVKGLNEMGSMPDVDQLDVKALRAWTANGHHLGNHTWDHPMLDQCRADEQKKQVRTAHEWFALNGFEPPLAFAYPNGNWAPSVEAELRDLGYREGLLFDHKTAAGHASLKMSRIRVNAADPLQEFISRVSGIHPAMMNLRRT